MIKQMNINKYFQLKNYRGKIKSLTKKYQINHLSNKKFTPTELKILWNIDDKNIPSQIFNSKSEEEFFVFGIPVKYDEINWHEDKFSGFEYPKIPAIELDVFQYFDQGIDLVFPWEQSRFYFATLLGQKYKITKNPKYYEQIKQLIIDWIDNNKFLVGVNWFSTMDIAIRAMNWTVGINFCYDLYKKDQAFQSIFTESLVKHGEYISKFPAIYDKNLTTNHTVSAFSGLLFIGLSLSNYEKSNDWIEQARNGLMKCMEEQIYDDGVDFEGSIQYHRLVLELFAYSTIAAHSQNIMFTHEYYKKLYKMFEFSRSYMDPGGMVPQIGDNDSGRALIFYNSNHNFYLKEHNHEYLLALAETIFEVNYESKGFIKNWLPKIAKIIVKDKSKFIKNKFEDGGFHFLRNDNLHFALCNIPIGQKGKGGHNHLDKGSFTLTVGKTQLIVDPGSSCYSKNKAERDLFRGYDYHNVLYVPTDDNIDVSENSYWELSEYFDSNINVINENKCEIKIKNKFDDKIRKRTFEVNNNEVSITDQYQGAFQSIFHLHPEIEIIHQEECKIVFSNSVLEILGEIKEYKIENYEYSPFYGKKVEAKRVVIYSQNKLEIKINKK